MRLSFFAVFLALAVPLPALDSVTVGADEEVLVESARAAKAPLGRTPSLPSRLDPPPPVFRPAPVPDPGLPFRRCSDWTPRLFSRPPPL